MLYNVTMTVSILIRAKDEERSIGEVLEHIFAQQVEDKLEVILVDSGSADRTLEIARRFEVRILGIPPSEFSYGNSLNYGIGHSSGDILCCISAHCVPCDDRWLSELLKPIMEGKAHATFGRQVPVGGVNPFEELFLETHFPADEKTAGRVSFSNANCAFVRKMWDEVKFDERISGWEDYLWYLLTKDRFIFRYTPNSCVVHSHPFSIKRMARVAYHDGKAFRSMKERYELDILGDKSSATGKLRYIIKDISSNALFFLRKGYFGAIFLLPFLKAFSYLNYWRGYNSPLTDEKDESGS